MNVRVEVPQNLEARELREALEAVADELVVDVALMPL